jgi:hypothetical protein
LDSPTNLSPPAGADRKSLELFLDVDRFVNCRPGPGNSWPPRSQQQPMALSARSLGDSFGEPNEQPHPLVNKVGQVRSHPAIC